MPRTSSLELGRPNHGRECLAVLVNGVRHAVRAGLGAVNDGVLGKHRERMASGASDPLHVTAPACADGCKRHRRRALRLRRWLACNGRCGGQHLGGLGRAGTSQPVLLCDPLDHRGDGFDLAFRPGLGLAVREPRLLLLLHQGCSSKAVGIRFCTRLDGLRRDRARIALQRDGGPTSTTSPGSKRAFSTTPPGA